MHVRERDSTRLKVIMMKARPNVHQQQISRMLSLRHLYEVHQLRRRCIGRSRLCLAAYFSLSRAVDLGVVVTDIDSCRNRNRKGPKESEHDCAH